jgi:hypothetical protein
MRLLTPAFLAGLAALAIPLIIHLIRRERRDAVEFPSLMFLSRIPQPVVKRRRIRNWWLFALRCIALILLVGAFARPFVDRSAGDLAAAESAREVVILLDRSYSMGHGDNWARARAAAHAAVDALSPNDRASLVVFDAGARMVVQPTADRARLRSALDSTTVGAGVTKYTPALKMAQSVLAASVLGDREAVLISDFQRTGWDGAAGAQLPAGAVLRPVHIAVGNSDNIVVTGVTLTRARISGRERITPVAHIANRGESATRVNVTLELDGRSAQSLSVDVGAHETRGVGLQPVTLGDQAARGTVRVGADALMTDNEFHFVLEPDPGLRVLVVQPDGRDASLYLRRALDLAEDPPFQVTQKRAALPTGAELERADVVLLNDVLPPDGDAGRRLAEWVHTGGGLVIGLGDRTASAPWGAVARELAGGTSDRVVDRVDDGGARLGYLDYSHPVFELFRAPRAGGFGAARFYRYRPVPVPATDAGPGPDSASAGAAVLARFDDGSAALVERAVGAGRVLVWGTTFDAYWSNLALEPIYLPLVHQIVRRGAGFEPPRQWTQVGQVVDMAIDGSAALVVNTPGGTRLDVADNSLVTLDEQGFYEVREARAGGRTLRHHAVNVDVTESDVAALDPAEVATAVMPPAGQVRSGAARALAPAEQEQRQALWWYLLIVVFGLLITEAVLANRRSVRPATR